MAHGSLPSSERPKLEFDFRPNAEISVHCRNRNSVEIEFLTEIPLSAETDLKSCKIASNIIQSI
jgi:hypothetical protein